jgi:hypothetical protein
MAPEKKKFIFLYSLIFIGFLLIPKPADALFGIGDIGVLDLAEVQLDALDFVENIILRILIFIILLLVESQIFLRLSAALFEWAISLPINLSNTFVLTGWNFTVGLVNLFFILILVAIALAYILRVETLGMKKALSRLIIIALLINFSLLFVRAFVDVAYIIQKSIIDSLGGVDFISLSTKPLDQSLGNLFGYLMTIPTVYIASSLIPYANVAALVGIAVVFLGELLFGTLTTSIFLIVIGFGLGSIFFLYFVLSLMRIGMLWILAIVAPIAFICYILPQTKKWWDEWLEHLVEWAFLGIIVIFFTGLGLKLFAVTSGEHALLPWGTATLWGLPAFTPNYLFLLVYLGILFFYSTTKLTPTLSKALISYGKGLAKGGYQLAKAKTLQRDVWGPAAGTLATAGERMRKRAEMYKEAGKGGRATLMKWTGRGAEIAVKPFKPALIEYAAKQRRVTPPAGWKQMSIPEKRMYIEALPREADQLVLASEMKEEKTYQKTSSPFREKMRKIRDKFVTDLRYRKEVGDLFDAEPDEIEKEVFVNFKVSYEMSRDPKKKREDIEKGIEEDIKKVKKEYGLTDPEKSDNQAVGVLYARGFKPSDIASMTGDSVKSLPVQLAMRRMGSSQLQALRNNFDEKTVEAALNTGRGLNTKKEIPDEKALSKIYKENSRLVRWAFNTPAGREMLDWSDRFSDFLKKMGKSRRPPKKRPPAGYIV